MKIVGNQFTEDRLLIETVDAYEILDLITLRPNV
jgi:hypothetical protein